MGLFFSSESYLGIDIGSSSIKIVELKNESGKIKLLTYGFSENLDDLDNKDPGEISAVINKICLEAGVFSRKAISIMLSAIFVTFLPEVLRFTPLPSAAYFSRN